MAQDPKREPVHFGYIMRRVRECLPADITGDKNKGAFALDTISGLAALSGQYLSKLDLDAGIIHFKGHCSYSQLAKFCRVSPETARWRCRQLRDRWGLMGWRRTKLGIAYAVGYEIRSVNQENESINDGLADSESSPLTEGVESVNREARSVNAD